MKCYTKPYNLCPQGVINSKCVVYTGINLTNIGVITNDRLDVILEKINNFITNSGTIYIEDTITVNLSGSGAIANPLSADVNLSTLFGNILTIEGDGLYAPFDVQEGINSGGIITWVEDYTFNVTAAEYTINNISYTSPDTNVTLDPADLTFDRFDVFAVDINGDVVVITGVPANDPQIPSIDPETQVALTSVLVSANTTQPINTQVQNWIYREAVEWIPVSSNPGRLNPISPNPPIAGVLSIEATNAINGDFITFTAPEEPIMSDYTVLTFKIRSKALWSSVSSLKFRFYDGVTPIGVEVAVSNGSYGFDSSNTVIDQIIVIPLVSFGNIGDTTILQMTVDTATSVGFYIDEMRLQDAVLPFLGDFWAIGGNNLSSPGTFGTLTNQSINVVANNLPHSTINTNGTIRMRAASPGISFGSGLFTASDYYIRKTGTSLITHAAGILHFNIAGASGYRMEKNLLRGHEWYSMQTPTSQMLMNLLPDGSLRLNNYGVNTFTGVMTKYAAFTALGNVIEVNAGSGGEILSADNGLTENVPNNVQLGGPLITNTSVDLSTFTLTLADTAGSGYVKILPNSSTGVGTTFTVVSTDAGLTSSAVNVNGNEITLQGDTPATSETYYLTVAAGAATLNYTDTITPYRISVGNAIGGTGIELFGLPNTSTQDRIIGLTAATNIAGYVTLGSGLSLTSGVLSSTGITAITADNGLTATTSTNTQLGSVTQGDANSPLLHTTYINTTSAYQLIASGGNATGTFRGINTSGGYGIEGLATSGTGVAGNSTSGVGGGFSSASSYALSALSNSTSNPSAYIQLNSSTTAVSQIMQLVRLTTGTVADGLGGSLRFVIEDNTGGGSGFERLSNELISKWTTAATATRTSQLIITGVNSAVTADLFTLSGSGATRFNKYGISTFTGTPTTYPAFDVNGNIIEVSGIGSGPVITADNGLTKNSATNVQLGGPLINATTTLNAGTNLFIGTSTFTDGSVNSAFTFNNTLATGSITVGLKATVVSTNASSAALVGESSTGAIGVYGNSGSTGAGVLGFNSSNGIGGDFRSTSGTGVSGFSNNSIGGNISIFHSSTNTYREVLRITRNSSGTATNGIGGYISFDLEASDGQGHESANIGSSWTDVTSGTRTGDLQFFTTNSAVSALKMTIAGDGTVTLAGTPYVGLGAGFLAVSNTGVLSWSAGGGGGSGTVNTGAANTLAYYPGAGTTVDDFPLGTANQILGMNSGASANEYKTLAVGTAGTDFAIAHSANTITFNLPDASASNRGAVTTGTQTFAGVKTLTSNATLSGGFKTNATTTNSNLFIPGSNTAGNSNAAQLLVEGAANTSFRVGLRGSSSTTIAANDSYGGMILGTETQTEPASGTSALLSRLIIKPDVWTSGAGAVTNTATVYIEGPTVATVTDQSVSLWVASGVSRFGKSGTATGSLRIEGATSGAAIITVPTVSGTPTLTLPIVTGTIVQYVEGTTASSATPTPTGDARENYYDVTALATNATFSAPSGTPANHNGLLIRITSDATPRTLAWNAIYRASTSVALPIITTASTTMYVQFVYNNLSSTWDMSGLTDGF